MEASLIGKALDFGSKECGFESPVSKIMPYDPIAFLVNHINFSIITRRRWTLLKCNKKMLRLLQLLRRIGIINSFILIRSWKFPFIIKLSPLFYKSSTFFNNIRLMSTPSKRFNVKLKTLKIMDISIGKSLIILETSRGFMTHKEALRLGISGKLLLFLS